MKNRAFVLLLALAALPSSSWAESITGTITNIDQAGGRVTVLKAGTNESVNVSFSDRSQLAALRSGSSITLDANRSGSDWRADSVTTTPVSSTLSSTGSLENPTNTARMGTTDTTSTIGTGASSGGSSGVGASSIPAGVNTNADLSGIGAGSTTTVTTSPQSSTGATSGGSSSTS